MEEIIEFCRENIREGLDPVQYAYGLVEESDDQYYEIAARDSKSGNPVTIDLRNKVLTSDS